MKVGRITDPLSSFGITPPSVIPALEPFDMRLRV